MTKFVVIGGGIAGVSCAQTLAELVLDGTDAPAPTPTPTTVTLVTASATVKAPRNVKQLARTLVTFDVLEENADTLARDGIQLVHGAVGAIDTAMQEVVTTSGTRIPYDRLCVCSGAAPRLVVDHPNVVGIRDTDSVQDFVERLRATRRMVILGNGGVALELVHAVRGCEVVWVIREDSIGTTFFDEVAAKFLVDRLDEAVTVARSDSLATVLGLEPHSKVGARDPSDGTPPTALGKRRKVDGPLGAALGPNWNAGLATATATAAPGASRLILVVQDEFAGVDPSAPPGWPVRIALASGRTIDCDLVVSATGVTPHLSFVGPEVVRATDGGLAVDRHFRTNVPAVYAAGDACTAAWPLSRTWLQMRLWTQARIMGIEAARAMADDTARASGGRAPSAWIENSLAFELFSHVTEFFGLKVVLLGLFNGQGLPPTYEAHIRATPGDEYVKAVVVDGRLVGALLIGPTDLEETFENLILNGTDVSAYGDALLDPDVDLEDYFD